MKKSSKNKNIRHIDLKAIKDPSFLRGLNYKELDVLSEDIKDYILDVTSKNGGHLSSNLGVRDLTIALCRTFDFSKDKIVFDVGHQCYTYKILTGRDFSTLRQKDGISGFQKINESPYDHYEAGHSSTSISAAEGLAIARDLKKEHYDVIALIGDASVVNGLSFEALNNNDSKGHKVIIVLNINDMSIGVPTGAISKQFRRVSTSRLYSKSKHAYKRLLSKTAFGRKIYAWTVGMKNRIKRRLIKYTLFDNLGYNIIGPIDGHNIKALEKGLINAKRSDRSVIVMTKTLKGKGYEPAENDKAGVWHGIPAFDIESGEIKKDKNKVSWSNLYGDRLYNLMKENKNVITVVPATGFGSSLDNIQKDFSSRFFDVGICEEHGAVLSSAISIGGFHPVYSIYSTFLQRAYDEISHDLARLSKSATLLIDRAGLVGEDGETHQGLYDEQFLYGIPNTVITMASKPEYINSLLRESINEHGVFAIRYPRGSILNKDVKDIDINFGDWIYEQTSKNKKTAIVCVGPIINELKEAIKDRDVTIVDAIYQKPLNEKVIRDLLNYKKVIIYDAYATKYGFASILAARFMELSYKGELIIKAVDDAFVKQGTISDQLKEYKISIEDIKSLV